MNTKSRDNGRFLPIGVQDFEKMIQGDFTYVDKTRYIHAMVRPLQGFYFLARPRRFGKSLLVSTLSYLFQGKKALFDGLWIGETDWDWEPHPVVALDFNTIDTARDLEASLCRYLGRIARTWEIGLSTERLKERFAELILGLSQKTGKTVVVLIETVKSIFASIPYSQFAGQNKAYYHTAFYLMRSASGISVHTEVLTSQGRMDMAVAFQDKVYILELKCNQSSDKAIAQIMEIRKRDRQR